METPVAYVTHTTEPGTGADDLLDRIRAIVEERDAYRATCQRQGAIITKLADLMGELQAYINETQVSATVETPTKPPKVPQNPLGRRYTDEDVRGWAAALQAGASQAELIRQIGVSPHTLRKRLTTLGFDPLTGYLRGATAESTPPIDTAVKVKLEPTPKEGNGHEVAIVTSYDYDDETVAKWTRLIDEGRTPEWIADQYDVSPYLVRSLVRSYREERGETVEAFEAA